MDDGPKKSNVFKVAAGSAAAAMALGGTFAYIAGDLDPDSRESAQHKEPVAVEEAAAPPIVVNPVLMSRGVNVNPFHIDLKLANADNYLDKPTDIVVSPKDDRITWNATTGSIVGQGAPETTYNVKLKYGDEYLDPVTFTTTSAKTVNVAIPLEDDGEYGVGMPVRLHFAQNVTDKKSVEEAVEITTVPKQSGSWGWLTNRTLVWRPDEYWQPGTKVEVNAPLAKVIVAKERYGKNVKRRFTIGRSFVMKIDSHQHSMRVFESGEHVKSIPVSLGKNYGKYRTRSGVKIIFAKSAPYTMRSPDPVNDPYQITVSHAMRMTNSGEFIHSAPWSVGSQGRRNVSHGCTNVSPSNARWLYKRVLMGDVVETINTGRKETYIDNGWGSVWDLSPTEWRKYSALAAS